MAGNSLACFGLAVALMGSASVEWAQPLLAYVVRVGQVILGIELAGNFVLDFYRPRSLDQVPRPSFDSRLLGLIGEPMQTPISADDMAAVLCSAGFTVERDSDTRDWARALCPPGSRQPLIAYERLALANKR